MTCRTSLEISRKIFQLIYETPAKVLSFDSIVDDLFNGDKIAFKQWRSNKDIRVFTIDRNKKVMTIGPVETKFNEIEKIIEDCKRRKDYFPPKIRRIALIEYIFTIIIAIGSLIVSGGLIFNLATFLGEFQTVLGSLGLIIVGLGLSVQTIFKKLNFEKNREKFQKAIREYSLVEDEAKEYFDLIPVLPEEFIRRYQLLITNYRNAKDQYKVETPKMSKGKIDKILSYFKG